MLNVNNGLRKSELRTTYSMIIIIIITTINIHIEELLQREGTKMAVLALKVKGPLILAVISESPGQLFKNKNTQDDFLLKTIKFDDIKEIKSQLPSKKNYDGANKNGTQIKAKPDLEPETVVGKNLC